MAPKNGTVQEKKFFSKELNEEMTLLVYLLSNYSPLYKYHVIIAQDGHDYFRLGRIGRQVEELLSKREIDRSIIIGVPYKDVKRAQKHLSSGGFKIFGL